MAGKPRVGMSIVVLAPMYEPLLQEDQVGVWVTGLQGVCPGTVAVCEWVRV